MCGGGRGNKIGPFREGKNSVFCRALFFQGNILRELTPGYRSGYLLSLWVHGRTDRVFADW